MTATTVGYGDYAPVRRATRIMAIGWMSIGLAATGILLGMISSALTADALKETVTSPSHLKGEPVCAGQLYSDTIVAKSEAIVFTTPSGSSTDCFGYVTDETPSDVKPVAMVHDAPVIEYELLHGGLAEQGWVGEIPSRFPALSQERCL